MNKIPPKYPLYFFRWFCHQDYVEDIEGDLLERFEKRTNENKASKWLFTIDVLKLFRPSLIKPASGGKLNYYDMLKNHIKIAFRVFSREKSFALINVLGLSTGIAISLLIIQYARFEFSYENMFPKADRIMRVTVDYMDGETLADQDCEVFPPLGKEIKSRYPEVESFTRAYEIDQNIVEVDNQQFHIEKMYGADPSFFSIFDTPFLHGSAQNIFKNPYELVLSESTARKMFDRTDVVGELVKMPLWNRSLSMKIVGVIKDSPKNTHLKSDVLMSYQTLISDFGEKEDNWGGNNTYLYVLLDNENAQDLFSVHLQELIVELHEQDKAKNNRFIAQQIEDIHLYSNKSFEPEVNGDIVSVYFLLGIALLVIISAFVNYVNLVTSKALDRAKEVGIRKVVGSSKGQLTAQFFTETAILNIAAALLAILIIVLSKSWFINLAGLPPEFIIFQDVNFWTTLSIMMLAGILLSGSYPAFVLSSFKAIAVMKGKFGNYGKGAALRKGLVIFQFAVTIVLLIQTFTVYLQLDFLKEQDLGVNLDRTIVVNEPVQDTLTRNFATFKQEMLKYAGAKSVAASESVPGLPKSSFSTTTGINPVNAPVEHSYNFYMNRIDHEYLDLMDIELLAGENFTSETNPEQYELLVNEEAIRLWSFAKPEDAIGQKLKFWGTEATIIGVVKNYRHESPKSPFIPLIHYYQADYPTYSSIRFEAGSPITHLAQVEEAYKKTYPNAPFKYFFLDASYDQQFKADQQFKQVFSVITCFAILIACLGLFGLAAFSTAKRAKEIGIRKVIGASAGSIMKLLTGSFMKTVLISSLIGVPVTYWIVSGWLKNFAVRIDLSWWLFALPTLTVVLLAFFSISFKTLKVALSNPVDSLKDE
ncbi:MAG: ABC transporter permease [Bacteroidota bacterium]